MAVTRTTYAPLKIWFFSLSTWNGFSVSHMKFPHKTHTELHHERIESQVLRERKMDKES